MIPAGLVRLTQAGVLLAATSCAARIPPIPVQPFVAGELDVVRAFFEWPIIMPLMGVNQGDMDNGNLLLASAIVFRNEPF